MWRFLPGFLFFPGRLRFWLSDRFIGFSYSVDRLNGIGFQWPRPSVCSPSFDHLPTDHSVGATAHTTAQAKLHTAALAAIAAITAAAAATVTASVTTKRIAAVTAETINFITVTFSVPQQRRPQCVPCENQRDNQ